MSADDSHWASLLRGGAAPAAGVGALCAAGFGLSDGVPAAASALVGCALALAALATGPWLVHRSRGMEPLGVMAVALLAYGVVVAVLGVAFAVLSELSWLRGVPTGVALALCTMAWTAGQTRATARLRVLAFGSTASPTQGL